MVGSAHDGAEMTVDRNLTNELSAEEELVRRYFHEVLDQEKWSLLIISFILSASCTALAEPLWASAAFAA